MEVSSDQLHGQGFPEKSGDHSIGGPESSNNRQLSASHTNGPSLGTHELKPTEETATKKETSGSSTAEETHTAGSKLLLIMVALSASMFLVALVSFVSAIAGKSSRICH